jgi:hypothetical protein
MKKKGKTKNFNEDLKITKKKKHQLKNLDEKNIKRQLRRERDFDEEDNFYLPEAERFLNKIYK